MAALLVGMAVMAILMSVALPTWNQMVRREKEEELVFRGTQYARAINFYQRRYANASPPNLDVLIEQHMLRKKFKDPMSPDKDGSFQLLYLSNTTNSGRFGGPSSSSQTSQTSQTSPTAGTGMVLGTTPTGGIMGVASKNKGESIRVYNGKTHYNEWQFTAMQQSIQGGSGAQTGTMGGPTGMGGSGMSPGTMRGGQRSGGPQDRSGSPPPNRPQGQGVPPPQGPAPQGGPFTFPNRGGR